MTKHDTSAAPIPSSAGEQPEQYKDPHEDGIDRRGFLSCMAWAGTGLLWTMAGGVPTSRVFAASAGTETAHGANGAFDLSWLT